MSIDLMLRGILNSKIIIYIFQIINFITNQTTLHKLRLEGDIHNRHSFWPSVFMKFMCFFHFNFYVLLFLLVCYIFDKYIKENIINHYN